MGRPCDDLPQRVSIYETLTLPQKDREIILSLNIFTFESNLRESTKKLLLNCKTILKNFQLTSRVECKPSLFFGPSSFFMFSFMFSFLCCLKAFSWSHRAILNRRSGDELHIKQKLKPVYVSSNACFTDHITVRLVFEKPQRVRDLVPSCSSVLK